MLGVKHLALTVQMIQGCSFWGLTETIKTLDISCGLHRHNKNTDRRSDAGPDNLFLQPLWTYNLPIHRHSKPV